MAIDKILIDQLLGRYSASHFGALPLRSRSIRRVASPTEVVPLQMCYVEPI
jgi:hypothetical protein